MVLLMQGSQKLMDVNQLEEFNLEKCHQYGEGASSIVYTINDEPNIILKLFNLSVSRDAIQEEYIQSIKMLELGLPTPEAYKMVRVGEQIGIIYRRITNKISFSKALAKDFDNAEALMKQFAELCQNMHNTKANTSYFKDQALFYDSLIDKCQQLDTQDKLKAHKLLASIEKKDTVLHGDMHTGNVVLENGKPYWIDLGAISYGNPMFDVSTLYFLFFECADLPFVQENFHLNAIQLRTCWKLFAKYYAGINSEEELNKYNNMLRPISIFFNIFGFVVLGFAFPEDIKRVKNILANI